MLIESLPAPKNNYSVPDWKEDAVQNSSQISSSAIPKTIGDKIIPSYPNRNDKIFIPVDDKDFGDGGAYPEIHIVQYPLDLGKPGVKSTAVISVNVDENGQVSYDAVVKQGVNRNKIIQTSLQDIKEKEASKELTALPDEKEEQDITESTKYALEALLNGKIKSSTGTSVVHSTDAPEPTYIRYTPNPSAPGATGHEQRIIRMVEAQVDPMEPPKHKHKKAPRGPPSPPVPILHSPPRKLTVADQQAWKIPPCISNWKNAKGHTIPLDKRLAADGRGLQEVTISNKFAMLSEALYISERKASEDLRVRNQIRKKMALREKEDKEKELRDMALQARLERAGISGNSIGAMGGVVSSTTVYNNDDEEKNEGDFDEPSIGYEMNKQVGNSSRRQSNDDISGDSEEEPNDSYHNNRSESARMVPPGGFGRGGISNLPAWMTKDASFGNNKIDEKKIEYDDHPPRRDIHHDRDRYDGPPPRRDVHHDDRDRDEDRPSRRDTHHDDRDRYDGRPPRRDVHHDKDRDEDRHLPRRDVHHDRDRYDDRPSRRDSHHDRDRYDDRPSRRDSHHDRDRDDDRPSRRDSHHDRDRDDDRPPQRDIHHDKDRDEDLHLPRRDSHYDRDQNEQSDISTKNSGRGRVSNLPAWMTRESSYGREQTRDNDTRRVNRHEKDESLRTQIKSSSLQTHSKKARSDHRESSSPSSSSSSSDDSSSSSDDSSSDSSSSNDSSSDSSSSDKRNRERSASSKKEYITNQSNQALRQEQAMREELLAKQQREKLRLEKRKERERELRLANMKGNIRKNKMERDEGRDISEKIALGMHKGGAGQLSGEALFDSRLFNQSSGMDSGFAADDEYGIYSKPLFDQRDATSIYRPKRDDIDVYGDADTQLKKLKDTARFQPDKGFQGTEGAPKGMNRSAPVQFERPSKDPYGLDDIVKNKKTRHE